MGRRASDGYRCCGRCSPERARVVAGIRIRTDSPSRVLRFDLGPLGPGIAISLAQRRVRARANAPLRCASHWSLHATPERNEPPLVASRSPHATLALHTRKEKSPTRKEKSPKNFRRGGVQSGGSPRSDGLAAKLGRQTKRVVEAIVRER
jgi:hypothetical protein